MEKPLTFRMLSNHMVHTPQPVSLFVSQGPFNPGAYAVGQISDEERFDVVRHACPGPGACGGMFTANTMSSVLEVLGISLPYSSSTPAVYVGMCLYPDTAA